MWFRKTSVPSDIKTWLGRVLMGLRRQWRAFIYAPGVTLALTIGVVTIATTVDIRLALIALPVGYFAGAILTLRRLSPGEYARIIVAGRPAREIIVSIAEHIDDLLAEIDKGAKRAAELESNLITIATSGLPEVEQATEYRKIIRKHSATVDAIIKRWKLFTTTKRFKVERIERAKSLAAQELGLSSARLCSHMFEYSPTLHRTSIDRFVKNYQRILSLHDGPASDEQIQRFGALVAQNVTLRREYRHRSGNRRRLVQNARYLDELVELAQGRSAVDSLEAFARLLSQVATEQRACLRRARWDGDVTRGIFLECRDQFLFFQRKQRAYAGADITSTLIRAIETLGE